MSQSTIKTLLKLDDLLPRNRLLEIAQVPVPSFPSVTPSSTHLHGGGYRLAVDLGRLSKLAE
jgi:hypothetical protein